MLNQVVEYLRENAGAIAINVATAIIIFILALIVGRILGGFAAKTISRRGGMRGQTLAPIMKTIVFIVVFVMGLIMSLDHVGVDVGAILAGAGVLGLAIGFGAQTLVKDCLSGFFLILDDVLAEGDVVELQGVTTGVVERVGLRMTQLRTFSGQLWYVPNGQIAACGNYRRGWVRAVVPVGLAYEQDARKGLEVLEQVGKQWAEENPDLVLEPPEAQGLLDLADSSVNARLVVKIKADDLALWGIERELRSRVKAAFDEAGVEIPFPRNVVYHRQEDDAGQLRLLTSPSGQAAE